MANVMQKIGFSYFTSPKYLVNKHVNTWMSRLSQLGASAVIFSADFERAIPEDVFLSAQKNGLEPIVHFTSELPLARKFNDIAFLLDVYGKWGCRYIILGDRPNIKSAWPSTGWQYENLVDHFLDRFIPLANHAMRIGMDPGLPPLQPGGDFWDTAFLELALQGMQHRRMDKLLDHLILSSYGFTFNKSLSWGKGGPEQWSVSKPYLTPEGQQDQLGFQNFEWVQALGQRSTGKKMPVVILDAGHPGMSYSEPDQSVTIEAIQRILASCRHQTTDEGNSNDLPAFNELVKMCVFSLDTLEKVLDDTFTLEVLSQIFGEQQKGEKSNRNDKSDTKLISHYLLLPLYNSGVSDVVLNKVRPLIKRFHPTVGFSVEEAALARKVSIFPDATLFPEEKINHLRSEGCMVVVLPESGIEIATSLQGS